MRANFVAARGVLGVIGFGFNGPAVRVKPEMMPRLLEPLAPASPPVGCTAVSVRRARRRRQNSNAFVVPQEIRGDSRQLGKLTGAKHPLVHRKSPKQLKYRPWNPFQGQALS